MIKDILASVSKKMQIDFKNITSRIQHNGEKGTARENLLGEYLRKYIPEKFCFSKGTIVDYKDTQSRQVDIIIHDKFMTPYLVDMDSTKVIPIESVYSVIEVKSTLTKEELRKSIKNIASVRKLQKKTVTGYAFPTAGLVFAYDSDASLETVYKNLVELSNEVEIDERISCVCILNKGIILPIDKNGIKNVVLLPNENSIYAMFNNATDSLLLFYLILTQILNSITIFPPDLVAYAQSTEILDTSFSVPADYIPDDAMVNVMDNMISSAELKNVSDYSIRMFSGKLERDEILECIFGIYMPSLKLTYGSLEKIPEGSVFNFFSVPIENKYMLNLYKNFKQNKDIRSEEYVALRNFEEFIYTIYDNHREEMLKKQK